MAAIEQSRGERQLPLFPDPVANGMTVAAIRRALEDAEELPESALRAGVARAAVLAPMIISLARQAADGTYLMPADRRFLVLGLLVLSAAREHTAYPALLDLLHMPELEREWLFGIREGDMTTRMLVSLFEGDGGPLLRMVENRELEGSARTAAFFALARLVWEGRVERAPFLDLLDRFDREEMAEPDDLAWLGWEAAISLLGLRAFARRVERGWKAGRLPHMKQGDHDLWFKELQEAEERPEEGERFTSYAATPIDDVVESARPLFAEAAETEDSEEDLDPAGTIALNDEEIFWLAGFLTSRHATASTMPLEMVDGYFSALIAGPKAISADRAVASVWTLADGAPRYAGREQAELVDRLLHRYWTSIGRRLSAGVPHDHYTEFTAWSLRGRDWAGGFLLGMSQHQEAWAPLVRNRRAAALLTPIMDLVGDEYEPGVAALDRERREEIIEDLPLVSIALHTFWSEGGLGEVQPLRVEKIGRNDPCPCGSGKKYKKCCLPTLQ